MEMSFNPRKMPPERPVRAAPINDYSLIGICCSAVGGAICLRKSNRCIAAGDICGATS
jgi:hypothetical protein